LTSPYQYGICADVTIPDWLLSKGKSRAWFAGRIETSEVSVIRYINGTRFPRPEILTALELQGRGVTSSIRTSCGPNVRGAVAI